MADRTSGGSSSGGGGGRLRGAMDYVVERRRLSSSLSPRTSGPDASETSADSFTEDCNKTWRTSCFRVKNEIESLAKYPGELLVALNAGSLLDVQSSSTGLQFVKDQYYLGGDVLRTEEEILGTSEPALYQTARYGNVSYMFNDLQSGEYFLDLHFAEIVFTAGPSGMRVFDVFVQGEKVIADLDLYEEVGSNKALMFCVKATVDDGTLVVAFRGFTGNPSISALCVRRSSITGSITFVPSQKAVEDIGSVSKKTRKSANLEYDAKLEALKNENHEAWISLQDANRKIETLQIDNVSKSLTIDTLASNVDSQEKEVLGLVEEIESLKKKADDGLQAFRGPIDNLYREFQELKSTYGTLAKDTKEWITSVPDASSAAAAIKSLVDAHDTLSRKYAQLDQERRQLYNTVLELQGNIRVYCRCRPLSPVEGASGVASVVDFDGVRDEGELIVRSGNSKKLFKFDRVFAPNDDQGVVFANTAPVVVSVLDGYNVCIFAYGQTGTGKTFTMEGTPEDRGVNYRTLEELFRIAEEREAQFRYEISVSVLEVYNEQIRDLLAPPSEPEQPVKKLEIRQDADGGHHIPGLSEANVHCMEEVWEVLQSGSSARAVESTNANQHSSRSHCMLCVLVNSQNLVTGECTRSKLWLVDLAGSERVAKTDVQGDRLREAQSINKSLSALGDVIAALTTKSSHVPYRNSKLTHLLQDSLGGDSKALMFVQISPSEEDVAETTCSLNFASRVRGVELGPARKQLDSSELFKFKQLAERAKQDGRTKEEAYKKLEENLKSTEVKLKVKEHLYQTAMDKMKDKDKSMSDLETQLAAEKKARLAAQAALKGKGAQLEKVLTSNGGNRDVKGTTSTAGFFGAPPERRPPFQEKQIQQQPLAEPSDSASSSPDSSPLKAANLPTNGRSPPVPKGLGVKRDLHVLDHENTNPNQKADVLRKSFEIKKKVIPGRYNSPTTIRRKLPRMPMRASIAAPYQINQVMLRESIASDELGARRERFGRMPSSHTRPPISGGAPAGTGGGSALFGRKKAVHFASPVFQKEKMAGIGQVRSIRGGDNALLLPSSTGMSQLQGLADIETEGNSIKSGVGEGAGGAGMGKLRRVSLVSRRASGQFPMRTTGGAQRVLSSSAGVKSSTLLPTPSHYHPRERRWN